ncbi:aldo-keto reductase AKR2E4-like [Plodia interpunctella]|uniref:aldo-keto reductase AKR2E4-like n=1 Tax=Plodia interpunctella TaxID=58824 RepID=UPI00236852CB|nr:aldo-keto reductase AKR2E4-like [Plodia interpunctella]
MTKVNIPTVKLNNGLEMPVLGLGTWLGVDDKLQFLTADIPKLVEALSYAIDIGYKYLDTAHLYRVEPEIGQVLNKKIREGVIKREDVFITTKIWQHNHRESDAIQSVKDSLRRLNLDYVDQVLIHWPMSFTPEGVDEKIDYLETWRGLEKVLEMGLVKSIGVSNFNVDQLKRLLANCRVPPVVNQVEINLTLGQKELVDFCQSNKIQVVAYSPFGAMMPFRQLPDSPEPKLNNPTMLAIAKKYGKTVTQITLRYLYQRNIISIPKTITKSRLVENASIFDFNLDADDVAVIAKFDVGYRSILPVFWQDLENYPFPNERRPEKEDPPLCYRIWKNGANADID